MHVFIIHQDEENTLDILIKIGAVTDLLDWDWSNVAQWVQQQVDCIDVFVSCHGIFPSEKLRGLWRRK